MKKQRPTGVTLEIHAEMTANQAAKRAAFEVEMMEIVAAWEAKTDEEKWAEEFEIAAGVIDKTGEAMVVIYTKDGMVNSGQFNPATEAAIGYEMVVNYPRDIVSEIRLVSRGGFTARRHVFA